MKKEGIPNAPAISDKNLNKLRAIVRDIRDLATMTGDEQILVREKAERVRRKGYIPDSFSLNDTDKVEMAELLSKVSDEKLKEIDDFFIPFSYDPTRTGDALVNERNGEENPQWVIDMTSLIYREMFKRKLVVPRL